MSTIQNYRDQQLQATSPRLLKLGSDYINLTSSHQYFKIDEAGTSTPSSIEIRAGLVGALSGTVVFSVDSGTATITQTDNTCTIQYSNMSTDTITILASLEKGGNTYESRYTLTKVRDGASGGYTLIPDLLSEVDVVSTLSNGTGYTLPTGNAVKLYRGETIISSDVTYSVSAPATKNGLTASINSSTGVITLSGTSWTSDTETFTFVATYNTVPYAVLYSIAKSKAGSDSVIADLLSENDIVPTANDGGSYTLPTGNVLRLYKGGQVVSSNVTYSGGTTKNGLTLAIDSATGAITLSGTSWTSNTESFTLTAAYGGVNYTTTYKITKAKAGATGSTGPAGAAGNRGSVRLSGTAASAAWSDTTANAVFTNAGYTYKVLGDICTLSYSTTWTLTKFWDGSAWAVLSELIDGNLLVTGTIAGNKLAANTVTADKIDSRGLSIKDASGNIILAAGTALSTSNISGLGSLATQNSVTSGQVSGLGSFATLSQITSANVSTYIASAAIGSAYIGDLTASKITSGTFTGLTFQTAVSGNYRTVISNSTNDIKIYAGSATAFMTVGGTDSNKLVINATSSGAYPDVIINNTSPLPALWINNSYNAGGAYSSSQGVYSSSTSIVGVGGFSTYSHGVVGRSGSGGVGIAGVYGHSPSCLGVIGSATSTGAVSTNHGVRGTSSQAQTSGLIGVQNGYDFYADGTNTPNYGPFTGAHDCLFNSQEQVDLGDIVVDSECILKGGISNVICLVTKSTQPNQKGVVGVISRIRGYLRNEYPPSVFNMTFDTVIDDYGNETSPFNSVYEYCCDNYFYHSINALGEGQINVCGENGNLEIGDLIVASSQPGKGMRQSDDIIRSYTVAKVREPVIFDYPEQVKMVACIYLCG